MELNLKDTLVNELRNTAITYGDFTLSSGAKSTYYINIKKAYTNPELLKMIGYYLNIALTFQCGNAGIDRLGGVAIGGIPLVVAASLSTMKPYVIIRQTAKGYGTNSMIEGDYNSGDRIIIIEDVTTSGNSVIKAIDVVRNVGMECDTVVTLVDRESGAEEALEAIGVTLVPLVTVSDLI